MALQNDIDSLKDKIDRGVISVDDANVEMVLIKRTKLVTNAVPRAVRKALMVAVKAGTLGHIKKEGHKPEAFFHPAFKYLAVAARNERERKILRCVKSVAGWP